MQKTLLITMLLIPFWLGGLGSARAWQPGDLDGDSLLTLGDAIIALQVAGNYPLSVSLERSGDTNGDARLDMVEALYVLQVLAGLRSPVALASCGTRTTLFAVEPLEPAAYQSIFPLGATNPAGHTFPTVHTYMMLTDSSTPGPVVAPGNILITDISQMTNLGLGSTDYVISFYPCSEVRGYFDHVTTLTEELLAQVGLFDDCFTYSDNSYELCNKSVSIAVEAGTLLGYAGGPNTASAALDFGLRDTRITPLSYLNPERLISPEMRLVVCPYDYYEEGGVHDNLIAKLRVARIEEPVCGAVAHDLADTAQGLWYLQGSIGAGEYDNLALVPSNTEPATVGVLSVGNSAVGIDAYYFDFLAPGRINRSFAQITINSGIYCYDQLRVRSAASDTLPGILFLTLNSGHLVLEKSDLATCPADPETLTFTANAVTFER